MDSTNTLPQVVEGSNAVLAINENFAAASPAMVYAHDPAGSSGLVWAYLGGRWGGFLIAGDDATMGTSTTTYMVVDKSDGSVSFSTSTTNWNNNTDYARAYLIVTGPSSVTSYQDHRAGPGGTVSGSGGGGGGSSADDVSFDPSYTGLTATDVQAAIEEIASLVGARKFVQVALSDMTTSLTTGATKAIWLAPENGVLVDVWIGVLGASSSGVVRIDMNDSGGSVFTTRPSIDSGEATSLTGTAAVLDGSVTFSKGALFTFDIDDAGTSAEGLQVVVEYAPT